MSRILVWDLPTRVFHWLLAVSFFGAYLASDDDWLVLHVVLGYTVLGLVAFRLVWGLVGTRYARFASFAFGPRRVLAYLRSLAALRPERHVGHNPAGSWAIWALLALGLASAASGWVALQTQWHWLKDVHESLSNAMLAVVVLHIAGAVASSLLHRENLPRTMVDGLKEGKPEEGIRASVWVVGMLLAALVAGFWTAAWRGDLPVVTRAAVERQRDHVHDH
jgi:cytochrome b